MKKGLDKYAFFEHRISSVFFRFFAILTQFWEVRGFPQIEKNRKNRVRDPFGARYRFFMDFGSDFGTIFGDFGWILDGFLEFLGRNYPPKQ